MKDDRLHSRSLTHFFFLIKFLPPTSLTSYPVKEVRLSVKENKLEANLKSASSVKQKIKFCMYVCVELI